MADTLTGEARKHQQMDWYWSMVYRERSSLTIYRMWTSAQLLHILFVNSLRLLFLSENRNLPF